MMSPKIALIFSIFLSISLGFTGQIHASVGSDTGDYVIFRVNIPPMFIMNTSSPIQVLAIPFHDNKPVYASVDVHIEISGLNVEYNRSMTISVYSGRAQIIYLDPMQEGHYGIKLWAVWHGIQSRDVDQDFGVSPAPEPYELYFDQDGSHIHFKSKVLNSTGYIDPNVTFRIEIYLWDGSKQSLVSSYDVTNLTIKVPASWKMGILVVDVVDRYGWRNGMSIDLAHFQFEGIPVQYDYHYTQREPFASRQIWYVVIVIFVILGIAYFFRRWYGGK